jgi:leucyl aminopeptidase
MLSSQTAAPCDYAGEVKKKVAIVGKGLTFDSGGYNIKAGAGSMIELMKFE